MPCKACHKPKKVKSTIVQGGRYEIRGEEYICALVTDQPTLLYALIHLREGNRWRNPAPLSEVIREHTMIKEISTRRI